MTRRRSPAATFWPDGGVKPVDEYGEPIDGVELVQVGETRQIDEHTTQVVKRYPEGTRLKGYGNFQLDFLLYKAVGLDLTGMTNATLDTLSLPPKIVTPFVIMILASFFTRRNSKQGLDRYYAKMKTPVDPDPEIDHKNLEQAYAAPEKLEHRKLFPGTSLEIQRPTFADVAGFVICLAICFGIVYLAVLVASLGSG